MPPVPRSPNRSRKARRPTSMSRPMSNGWTFCQQEAAHADDTRINLLGNTLVLIAPKASKLDHVTDRPGLRHRQARRLRPHRGRRHQGGAGRPLCQAALKSLGAWKAAGPKLAQADNVRATLAYVARGETPLGIVYATDARIEPKVKIVGMFPADSHPPITYPVAAMKDAESKAVTRISAVPAHAGSQGDLRAIRLPLSDQASVVSRQCTTFRVPGAAQHTANRMFPTCGTLSSAAHRVNATCGVVRC